MRALLASDWRAWPAPAKINLFLRITGRRADGYHDLQTLFQLLDWGDWVHVRVTREDAVRRIGGDSSNIPETSDLLVKAAISLKRHANCRKGAELFVTKRIPVGGGFGGGSSDAATVLRVLDRLWGCDLGTERLAAIGRELGADVPVFVRGHSAWAEGVGDRLEPVSLPPAWFVLVDPAISVPTGELFQVPELTRDAAPVTIGDFASGVRLGNAFEPVLRRLQPVVDSTLEQMSRLGQAALTGTGSGCFLRFDSKDQALAAQAALPVEWRSWVVQGVSESPLLKALAEFAVVD